MPFGEYFDVAGRLMIEGLRLVLQVDDDGTWELDLHPKHLKLLGSRVRATGVRDGFDLLAVRTIEQG